MDEKKLNVVRIKLIDDAPLLSHEKVATPADAIRLMQDEVGNCDREIFCALHINARGKPLSMSVISIGELTATLVHPREAFKASILSNASSVIFMHNHPGGDVYPSQEDIKTTGRLEKAGEILGIHVVDHLIVAESKETFYSFRAKTVQTFDDLKRANPKKREEKSKDREAR